MGLRVWTAGELLTLVFLGERNVGWLFVESNTKTFEFSLYDSFVCQRFHDVQDD